MAALTKDRNTPRRAGERVSLPVEAATKLYAGAMIARNADGRAVPAANTAGLVVVGRAEHQADNSAGAAGDLTIEIQTGLFAYAHGGLTRADIGKTVYAADDQTVTLTPGNRVVAGVLVDVDDQGAWVRIGPEAPMTPADAQAAIATADAAVAAGASPTKAEFDAVVALTNETKAVVNGLLTKLAAARLLASS